MRKNIINLIVGLIVAGLICVTIATICIVNNQKIVSFVFFSLSGACLFAVIGLIIYAYLVIKRAKKNISEDEKKYIEIGKKDIEK